MEIARNAWRAALALTFCRERTYAKCLHAQCNSPPLDADAWKAEARLSVLAGHSVARRSIINRLAADGWDGAVARSRLRNFFPSFFPIFQILLETIEVWPGSAVTRHRHRRIEIHLK